MIRKAIVACVVAAAVIPAAPARTASETIEVTIVEVPVNVIDRNGNPVRGLKRENFQIFDGDVRREITHFEVVDLGESAAGTAPAAPARYPRQFMLLFDATNSAPATLLRARHAAADFVTRQVQPYDRVSVGTISVREGFRLLSAFTTDRKLTLSAIDTLGAPKQFSPRDPLLLTAKDMLDIVSSPGPGATAQQQNREQALLEALKPLMALQGRMDNDAHRHRIMLQLNALTTLGQTLDRVQGRKHVILMSEGFDPKLLQGRATTTSEAAEEQRAIETGQIWQVDTDNRYGSVDGASSLRATITALRRSDVMLHALDIKGVRTDVDAREGVQRSSTVDSLHLLTADTGGTVFRNTNDLSSDFARMLKMQEVTYVLGFSGASATPGKFHDLKVRLVDGPGGVRLVHRPGYYEPSQARNQQERTLAAGEIIVNRIAATDLKVAPMAMAFPRAAAPAYVPVVVEVAGAPLAAATEKTTTLEFFVYAFGAGEIIRDFTYQPVQLDVAKLRSKLTARGVKFFTALRLDPGDYSIRILVRAGAKHGFASAPLRVPDAGERFVMSPLIFDPAQEWVMVKAPERGPEPYPFQVSTDSFVPAVHPAVRSGSSVSLALFAGSVRSEAMRLTAKLLQDGGAATPVSLKFLGRAPDPDLVKLVWELQVPNLPRGAYSLVLDVAEGNRIERVIVPIDLQEGG